MEQKILFLIIPLIISIVIIPTIPFSDATEYTQICIDKIWIESTNNRIVCVTLTTAEKLVERGWGTLLYEEPSNGVESMEESKACTKNYRPVCGVDGKTYPNMCVLEGAEVEFASEGECKIQVMEGEMMEDKIVNGGYAQKYIVSFSGGAISQPLEFYTFSNYVPYYGSSKNEIMYGLANDKIFALEGLPSKDKFTLYQLASKYTLPGLSPEPFDVTIKVVSEENYLLYTLEYTRCELGEFSIYLQEIPSVFNFGIQGQEEIRERMIFSCIGNNFIPDLSTQTTFDIDFKLSDDERAMSYLIRFYDVESNELFSSKTFSSFSSTSNDDPTKFTLKDLVSLDKSWYYATLASYANPYSIEEPFEARVDLVTGDNTVLQTLDYYKCFPESFVIYLNDAMDLYPYSGQPQSEIRSESIIDCLGFDLIIPDYEIQNNDSVSNIDSVINDDKRAKSFVVDLYGGNFDGTYTFNTFSKYYHEKDFPPTDSDLVNPERTHGFWLEFLPSNDKIPFYDYVNYYLDSKTSLEPIDVNIHSVTEDSNVVLTIKYTSCEPTAYLSSLQDLNYFYQLDSNSQEEVREKVFFKCVGYFVDLPLFDD